MLAIPAGNLSADTAGSDASAMPETLPDIAKPAAINASLQALKNRHGVDLNRSMKIKHRVLCITRKACKQAKAWAAGNGYAPRAIKTVHGHGGHKQYYIDLVRVGIPGADTIHEQSVTICEAMETVDDAIYQTWMGEID